MPVDWDEVWERKGKSESNDRQELSGFERILGMDSRSASDKLCSLIGLQTGDSVLEVGCAAGLIAQHLKDRCEYVGIDRSASMVKKMIEVNHLSALRCDADNLIFKDKTFDHVFAFSVFQYFPDKEYAQRVLDQMKAVARKTVCVSDIPVASHEAAHMLYTKDFFAGWEISEAFYENERRFTALLTLT